MTFYLYLGMEYIELEMRENMPRLSGVVWSIDCLILGEQMLWLGRLRVQLP